VVFSVFQTGWSATAWARVIVKDYLRPAAVRVGVLSSEIRDVDGKKFMVITDERAFAGRFSCIRHHPDFPQ
jgi:hypothetical protein